MTHYDLVIIGFGKAGKTLAKCAASEGKGVAKIEKDQKMYGGTCINVGCIPSKTLIHDSLEGSSFASAFDRKREVVDALNNKNYHMLADTPGIDVINATAQFKSNKEVVVLDEAGQELDVLT
ncbi:dihydrolipoamide dehydrogenase, partial [Staphylococcus nepalensis]